jgi:hypothetical protein
MTVCRISVDMAGTKHDDLLRRLQEQLEDVRGPDPSPEPLDIPEATRVPAPEPVTDNSAPSPHPSTISDSQADDSAGATTPEEDADEAEADLTDPVVAQVQALAKEKLSSKFTVRRELKHLPSLLHNDEELINLAQGKYEDKQGLVVVTNKRVMFVEHGVMRRRLEDFPYTRVSSVQSQTGVMFGGLTIYASGNAANISDVAPKQRADEIGEFVREKLHAAHHTAPVHAPPSPESPQPAASDPYEQLKKLNELKEAGILTAEEFAEKKQQLLDRI